MEQKDMMKSFLDNFPNTGIFVLQDKDNVYPNRPPNLQFKGMRNIQFDEVEKYNSAEYRADIYFTPNGDFAFEKYDNYGGGLTKDGGRKDSNGKTIYCSVADIDPPKGQTINECIKTWEDVIEPTYIIKTGKGYHLYFMYDEPLEAYLYLDDWKAHMDKLYDVLGGDKKCQANKLSGVLRVPYATYWKDNMGEKKIEVYKADGPRYSFENLKELIENLYVPVKQEDDDRKESVKYGKSFADLKDEIDRIDVMDVFYKITPGKREIKGTRIMENGKNTGGYRWWKQRNIICGLSGHKIKDGDGDRPTGGTYAIVRQVLGDTRKTLEWFRDNYNIKIDEVVKEYQKKYTEAVVHEGSTAVKREHGYLVGTGKTQVKTDDRIGTNNFGMYYIYPGKDGDGMVAQKFCDGLIEPLGYVYISEEDSLIKEKRIIIKVTPKVGDSTTMLISPFSAPGEFAKALMGKGLRYDNNKNATKMLIQRVLSVDKRFVYANKLGLQEIEGRRVLIRRGGSYIEDDIFIDILATNAEAIEEPKYDVRSREEIVENLLKIYDGSVIYPLFLLAVYLVYIYYWRTTKRGQMAKQVPGGFVAGLQGAGKSFIKNLIFKDMLGIQYAVSASATKFSYEMNSTNYMPLNMEDYRNESMGDNLQLVLNTLRNAFDGTGTQKGTVNQTVNYYKMCAQFVFDGQTKFKDGATTTRQIYLMTTPKKKRDQSYVRYVENCMGNVLEIFKDREDAEKFLGTKIDIVSELRAKYGDKGFHDFDRVSQNYACLIALGRWMGLQKYEKILDKAMMEQLNSDEGDDVFDTYNKIFSLCSSYRGDVELTDGGLIIDINLENTRMLENRKDDMVSMIKSINYFFDKTDIDGAFVSFDYVFSKRQLRGKFRQIVERLYIPNDITKGMRQGLERLREFLSTNFKDSEVVKEINAALHYKEGGGDLPF